MYTCQYRYCATLLHYSTTLENWENKVDPIGYWLKNLHLPVCLQVSQQIVVHSLCNTEPNVASELLIYSLEYKDVEWFSRAALIQSMFRSKLPRQNVSYCHCMLFVVDTNVVATV